MIALLAGGVAVSHSSIHAQQVDDSQAIQSSTNIEQQSASMHQKLLLNNNSSNNSDARAEKAMTNPGKLGETASKSDSLNGNNDSSKSNVSQKPYIKNEGKWGTANVKYWSNDTMQLTGNGTIDNQPPQLPFSDFKNDWKLEINKGNANINSAYNTNFSGYSDIWKHFTSMDLSGLNTEKMTSMFYMFSGDSNLQSINLSGRFNTSNVTNMNGMFLGNSNLRLLDLSNFNTSKVTDMKGMFYNTRLSNLDLSHFDTNNVINMSQMFEGNLNLRQLNLDSFNTNKVSDMNDMFTDDYNLQKLDLGKDTHLNHNQTWNPNDSFKDANGNNITEEVKNGTQPTGKYYVVHNNPTPEPHPYPRHSLTSSEASYAGQINADINSISSYEDTSQVRSALNFARDIGGNTESLVNNYYHMTFPYAESDFNSDDYSPYTLNQSHVDKLNHGASVVSSAENAVVSVASSASASLSASNTKSYKNMAQSIANSIAGSNDASYASEIAQLKNNPSSITNASHINSYEFNSLENKVNSLESSPSTNSSKANYQSMNNKINDLENDVAILKDELNKKPTYTNTKHTQSSKNNKKSSKSSHTNLIYIKKLSKWRKNKINHIKHLRYLNSSHIKKAQYYLKHHKYSKSTRKYLSKLNTINKDYSKQIHNLHYRSVKKHKDVSRIKPNIKRLHHKSYIEK